MSANLANTLITLPQKLMAIFSNDVLQKSIHTLMRCLSEGQLKTIADKLNKIDEKSLHTEWELIVLSVFSKIGVIEHEKEIGGRKPDIWLSLSKPGDYNLVADITTVSDKGLKESLVNSFRKKFQHELGKRKLRTENFSPTFKLIKESSNINDYLNDELRNFLDKLTADKNKSDYFVSKNGFLTLKYHPDTQVFTWSKPITSHKKLSSNPFSNALKSKNDQLKNIKTIPKGIILCDGVSEMFFFRETCVLWFGSDDIIRDFLRRNSHINFVLSVWTERTPVPLTTPKSYKVKVCLFENKSFEDLDDRIKHFLRNIEGFFPPALMTVDVALDCIRNSTILNHIGKEKLVVI